MKHRQPILFCQAWRLGPVQRPRLPAPWRYVPGSSRWTVSSLPTKPQTARAGWSSSIRRSTSSICQVNWERSTGLTRGHSATVLGAAGAELGPASKPGRTESVVGVSFMAAPSRTDRFLEPAYLQGMAVLDDPLQVLAFFQLQGGSQRSRAD